MTAWTDTPDEHTAAIKAAHPTRSGKHETYATAMAMVGNRHSKGALVELVNWLLVERDEAHLYIHENGALCNALSGPGPNAVTCEATATARMRTPGGDVYGCDEHAVPEGKRDLWRELKGADAARAINGKVWP